MKYRICGTAIAGLLVSGCDLKGNIYAVTPQQAYDKLVAAQITPSQTSPFIMLNTSVDGDGSSTVRWHAGGTFAAVECEANLAPEGTDKTRVTTHCGGTAGDGASNGMALGMMRNRLIEHIDATLEGRAFDPNLAMGATAGTWPDDPRQADASLATAAGDALKMDQDMHQMIAEVDNASAQMTAQAAQQAQGVNFKPGEPMVNVAR